LKIDEPASDKDVAATGDRLVFAYRGQRADRKDTCTASSL